MSITDRNLKSGTRLASCYKGREYSADVVQTEEGARYRLEDGREFKSPSSAGSAVMGGKACNGWRFWSLAHGEAIKARAGKRRGKGRTKNAPRAFERLSQVGAHNLHRTAEPGMHSGESAGWRPVRSCVSTGVLRLIGEGGLPHAAGGAGADGEV